MNQPSAVLAKILVRERYSLLQYLSAASPWTPPGDRTVLDRLSQIAAEEKEALGHLGRRLQEFKVTPVSGCYPEQFTEYHYLGVDFLLPRLVQEEEKAIVQLEKELELLSDEEDRQPVRLLLEQKRKCLNQLRQMAHEYACGLTASTHR